MTPEQHTAAVTGALDRYIQAQDAQEREQLLRRARMHGILARRPELEEILPRIINHPKAALLIGGIR